MDKSIMPECYADTLLMQTLVPTKKGYNHQRSCFKVESEMVYGALKDKFAVGIIDKDKNQVRYLNDFWVIAEVKNSLILWRHNDVNRHHYFIQILPALERWIMNICEMEMINLVDYELVNDLNLLKRETKKISSIYNKKLRALFSEINKKENHVSVMKLKTWLKILIEKNYRLDINELKNA